MVNLDLTPEEYEVLKQNLASALAQLEVELVHTDHREFKELLRHRKAALEAVLAKLTSGPRTGGS